MGFSFPRVSKCLEPCTWFAPPSGTPNQPGDRPSPRPLGTLFLADWGLKPTRPLLQPPPSHDCILLLHQLAPGLRVVGQTFSFQGQIRFRFPPSDLIMRSPLLAQVAQWPCGSEIL